MTEKNKIRGKKARASGQRFELKVRKDLESKDWIVDKWSNNVEFSKNISIIDCKGKPKFTPAIKKGDMVKYGSEEAIPIKADRDIFSPGKLIPAKHKFRGVGIPMAIGTGFPDFICYRQNYLEIQDRGGVREILRYEVIGVECKSNGYLTEEEKEKCKWLLENNVFSKILIAKKGKRRGEIEYGEVKINGL